VSAPYVREVAKTFSHERADPKLSTRIHALEEETVVRARAVSVAFLKESLETVARPAVARTVFSGHRVNASQLFGRRHTCQLLLPQEFRSGRLVEETVKCERPLQLLPDQPVDMPVRLG